MKDNPTLSYKGNQLIKADDSAPDPTLFSRNFRDVKGSSIEYTCDANGNLTKDLNKGITQIQYSSLNLPKQVNFNPAGQPVNEYTYAVDGSKLQVNHKKSSGGKVTDYVGNMIYEGGSLKRILVDGGFYEEGKYYFYLKDHLGNNRVVADASGSAIQVTHYYPFGMSFTEGYEMKDAKPAKQPYKYNGKELDGENSLNWYDYEARQLAMDLPGFNSIDPLAEKYYSISPYAYVMNNPLRFIDPTGMSTVNVNGEDVDFDIFAKWFEQLKSAFGFGERKEDYSTPKKAKESQAHNDEQSERLKATAEGVHTFNETMLSFLPFGEVAYKGYWDREISTGDFGWEIAGIFPIGRFAGRSVPIVSKAVRTALASRIGKRGYTEVGYQFSKHAGRPNGAVWKSIIPEGATLNPNTYNEAGYKTFQEIWRAPGEFKHVDGFIEKRLPDGRGLRFQENWVFKGFLD